MAGPWEGAAISDGALSRVIREARLAIEDDLTDPKMIVTIRGKGFRFLPEVVVVPSSENSSQSASTEIEPAAPRARASAEIKSKPTNGNIFAGRRVEFTELNSAYDDARSGHGKFVLISGAPGIGKTALVEQFAEAVRSQGAEVLFGRSWEAQGTEPFWPWPELLENLAERRGRDWIETFAGDVLEDIRPLLPYGWTSTAMVDRHENVAAHRYSTFRVMRAAARFWQRVAESIPLVLVFEDLHLADAAALELLEFLCRLLDRSPLLLVGTCRTLDAQQRVQLRSAMEGALPHTQHVALRGLSSEDLVLWLRLIWGHASTSQFVNRVHGVTEGHPLLVKNLLQVLPDTAGTSDLDGMEFAAVQLPERIATSIRRRLEQLEPRTFELLQAASVSGEELPLSELATALDRDLSEVHALVEDAQQQGIVTRNAMGNYHFAHALIRATLYQDLHPNIRSKMHAALGRAYLDLVSERPQEIARAAHHLLAAETKDVASEAVDVAVQAAEWARRHESYELAADLYARALQFFSPGEGTPRRRAELLGNLARVQLFAGRADQAL